MKQFEMDGYVCGKVETRATQSGKQVTSFSVNSPERRQVDGEWQSVPNFFHCKYWHREHDFRPKEIVDKAHLFICGSPCYEEWEKDGQKRSKVVFLVRELYAIKGASSGSQQPVQEAQEQAPYADEDIPF